MSAIARAATCTIANGATVSNSIDLGEMAICGIQTPSALTGTAFTFQASYDNVTFCAVTTTSASYSVTVAASKFIMIPLSDLAGCRYLKVVSGSAEGADRDIILLLRQV